MGKDIGNGYGLYTSTTEPSTPQDIGEYDLAGFGTDLNLSRSRNQIDASNKDSGADSEYEAGRRDEQVSGTFFKDITHDNDAGQANIEDQLEDASGGSLWWLISDNVTDHVQYYGEAKPSQFDISFPDEGMVQIDVTLQVTGGSTRDAVT